MMNTEFLNVCEKLTNEIAKKHQQQQQQMILTSTVIPDTGNTIDGGDSFGT